MGFDDGGVISPAVFCYSWVWKFTPIRNDEDHAAALREIEWLEGAAAGTEEGDKLDILAMLFEKYEDSRLPNIDTSDPIDLLNYAIEAFRDSQAE